MRPTILLFGPNGLLGKHIKNEVRKQFAGAPVVEISRLSGVSILAPESVGQIAGPVIAFYCHGPTDPKIPFDIHQKFHVDLPKKWHQWFTANCDLKKFITFGSVHEARPLSVGNNYLTSKRIWFDYVNKINDERILHFQLHTVYGNPISRHSFVGEMFLSIRSGLDFEMSGGLQLREYHHVEDIGQKVVGIIAAEKTLGDEKVLTLSHGKPITLVALAEGVFNKIKPRVKLKVGALKSHHAEIVENFWSVTPAPFAPLNRDPIQGVSEAILRELEGTIVQ